jgi:hypothetical protein
VQGAPTIKKRTGQNVDLERTGCGDASACLSIVTHPVDVRPALGDTNIKIRTVPATLENP